MEIKEFGYIEKGTGQHQSNTIYDSDYLSPTLCACYDTLVTSDIYIINIRKMR